VELANAYRSTVVSTYAGGAAEADAVADAVALAEALALAVRDAEALAEADCKEVGGRRAVVTRE
jgi:hypothetical protein